MAIKFQKSLYLFSSLLIALSIGQDAQNRGCRPELPTLSVKDGKPLLDLQQWEAAKKKNDLIILGIADSQCPNCCQTEGLLQDFIALNMKYKSKPIPIFRIDISTPSSQRVLDKEELFFESVPRVIIVKDKRYFSYDSGLDRLDLFLHQINRIINPLVKLETEDDIVRFLGLKLDGGELPGFWEPDYNTPFLKQLGPGKLPVINEHWESHTHRTRVVCFFFDEKEYKEEVNNLRRDVKFLAARENLRVGIVTNQRLVKKMKSGPWGAKLFNPISMSSLVLRRYDGNIRVHDITGEDHISFHNWINKQTLKDVEELTNESYRIQELLRQPMFIAFVDLQDPRYSKDSFNAIKVLKEAAPKYSHVLGFFYVNNTNFVHRKRILGVTWDELPSMAFNFIGDASKIMPYPRGREISKEALFEFFDDLFTGRAGVGENLKEEYKPPQDFSKTRNDVEIETVLLNNTIIANRGTFNDFAYQEGYDAIVLLYTTEVINDPQRQVALQYNLVADAFNKLQQGFPTQKIGTSLRIISYDVNVNSFPDGIEFTLDIPQIVFLPAYHKRPPYKRFQGQAAIAGNILLFIEKNADVKFKYPVDVSRVGYPREDPQKQSNSQDQADDKKEEVANDEL